MSKRFTVEGRMLFIVNKVPSEIKSNKQIRESMTLRPTCSMKVLIWKEIAPGEEIFVVWVLLPEKYSLWMMDANTTYFFKYSTDFWWNCITSIFLHITYMFSVMSMEDRILFHE